MKFMKLKNKMGIEFRLNVDRVVSYALLPKGDNESESERTVALYAGDHFNLDLGSSRKFLKYMAQFDLPEEQTKTLSVVPGGSTFVRDVQAVLEKALEASAVPTVESKAVPVEKAKRGRPKKLAVVEATPSQVSLGTNIDPMVGHE